MIFSSATRRLMCGLVLACSITAAARAGDGFDDVRSIFESRCVTCHNNETRKGGLSLQTAAGLNAGADHGPVIAAGGPDASKLIEMVSGSSPKMPKKGGPLSDQQIQALRKWIAAGANFPAGITLEDRYAADLNWWSLKPIVDPELPPLSPEDQRWARHPIDAFVLAKMREKGLTPAPRADRRTLIRRLYFDLTGLPPSPDEVDRFVRDDDPAAYEKLVDALLASPAYGERWASHWLDTVHYGDTHGYDKDKVRSHAWPYRDYVVRAFNEDRRYSRFVKEQLAGDVFYPGTADGILGLGFIAAGPWDYVGHVELGENQPDKQIVRNLDRDDMVTVTMNTFVSLTVQCARCHHHKFDPISQEDYYALQSVFAAVDRADRSYTTDPSLDKQRRELVDRISALQREQRQLQQVIADKVGQSLKSVDAAIAAVPQPDQPQRPQFGYHSQIAQTPEQAKWVQIDLGASTELQRVVLHPAYDTFANIGAGFGFPVRYQVQASDDPQFVTDVRVLADHTEADVPNPGIDPVVIDASKVTARHLRITATMLALRRGDYIFALAEVDAITPDGANVARDKAVSSLDSIEAPVRWARVNLTDGIYYTTARQHDLAALKARRQSLIDHALNPAQRSRLGELRKQIDEANHQLESLARPRQMVYAAATDFESAGNFTPTRGKPRPVYKLLRGSESSPDKALGPMQPGAVSGLAAIEHHFDLPPDRDESAGRAALAEWIVDRENPLTWRTIVNRVWQYHFTHGLVDSPNDFGRMGAEPTHPLLLDYLARRFRDGDQSIKQLHRLILTSATYQQASTFNTANARIDGSNQYLWRQNRRKLDAEEIRDTTLLVAGKLDRAPGGPPFMDFGFKDDHSPHYKYGEYNPDDPATHRRAIYRMVVRSAPNPFMEALDCADPSQIVPKRLQTLTALQALTLLNDRFMVRMAEHFAERIRSMADRPDGRIAAAYRLALGRHATPEEIDVLLPVEREHGLANVCRILLNSNEFIFID